MSDPLDLFSAPVRAWFVQACGQPTPPQAQGWPVIRRGDHALILSPTGSGKTLAAFLYEIDRLYHDLAGAADATPGIRLVYISPLKALNNDVERNLRQPLEGIRAIAAQMGRPLPPLRVAVRTGDTPGSERAAMLKHPPHILITTPESLYLMLTSPRAREMFRAARTVIIDEIHTLCGNKRGVHLSLSLERLCHLAAGPVQRIGLSATQRPLDEVARFLGGQEPARLLENQAEPAYVPRPVTLVEAGYKKPLDLQVVTVVDDFRDLPADTVWPSVVPSVLNDIRRHRSTLIFCNNRRLAERTADRLNAQLEAEQSEEIPPGSTEALAPGGVARDRGMFAIGASGPIKAHHGSTSKESRRQMEEDLKAGKLPALIGTSSLELGIDIGAVDLVVQLQSPKSVAQGLQRVGRSGHLVGQTSAGRIYATFREDLLEAAAVARGMLDGDVELTYTPLHPLDVLAQHIVAMVSVETWEVAPLFNLVRQAYAYRALSWELFCSVLDMLSARRPAAGPDQSGERLLSPALKARIVWDRVNNRLAALPGSRLLAITNGGTIPDTGMYSVYLADGKTKLGELDEEFIFETRPGDVFLLGSHVWRVQDIDAQRIVVADASGATPRMPFWRGDYPWRPYELGCRIGRFRAAVAERVALARSQAAGASAPPDFAAIEAWLRRDYALDEKSARNLVSYVDQQLEAIGVMSTDATVVVESFQDAVGEPHVVIHSPFGGRINGAWALAITSALRERIGIEPETLTNDDGILLHFPRTTRTGLQLPAGADMVQGMTAAQARERILRELPDSAVFGAHFRMNAARALLLPRARGGQRTPFWLQRLKARDLLAAVRRFDDFPIMAETYRDCLRDVFDLPHLEHILERIQSGEIQVVPVETLTPSPVASGLLFNFTSKYMYEWDAPKAERQLQELAVRRDILDDVLQGVALSDLLKPQAVAETQSQAQHAAAGFQARSAEELALILDELGDLTAGEAQARCAGNAGDWLAQLKAQGRASLLPIPVRGRVESRWVPAELAGDYRAVLPFPAPRDAGGEGDAAARRILRRLLANSGPLTRAAMLARYDFDPAWLDQALAELAQSREIARGRISPGAAEGEEEFCDRRNLERIHRRTITLLRKEIQPAPLFAYADFLCRWQHAHPDQRLAGMEGARQALRQLRGVALPGPVWEQDALPARVRDYRPAWLDALCEGGEWVWVGSGRDPRRGRVRFFGRGEGGVFLGQAGDEGGGELSAPAQAVDDYLRSEGASFIADLQANLRLDAAACQAALAELVMAGRVTNDAMGALRRLLSEGAGEAPRPVGRSQPDDLAARLGQGTALRPPSAARMREAKRRVTERLRGSLGDGPAWTGRWSPVRRAGVMGPPLPAEERAARVAQAFLERYGVVMRECLDREEAGGEWPAVYPQLQRLEMRGEVRRGYFVAGVSGVQFALPEAVEQLRACAEASADAITLLNAADPINLYGGDTAAGPDASSDAGGGPLRFARLPSTHCALWRGRPVLVAEDGGDRITALDRIEPVVVQRALQAYLSRPNAPKHVLVSQWNGQPAASSAGQALLHGLGFYRVPAGMEWWSQV